MFRRPNSSDAACGPNRTLVRSTPAHECSGKEQTRRLIVRAPSRERNISHAPLMRKINTRSFVRATRWTPREINLQIVLNLVREHEPISRAELARRMKIGPGMVTYLTAELIAQGALYEGATVDSPRGRRPQMLYVRTRDRLVVAVDVRFSSTFIMLTDFSGHSIALESFDTISDPVDLVAELQMRVKRLLATHGDSRHCEGLGLVVPGMVDASTGRV